MNRNLDLLAERREKLIAKSAAQREALAQTFGNLRAPLALADRAVSAVRYIKHHPGILAGATFIIAILLRRYTKAWSLLSWAGMQLGRNLLKI